MPTAKPYLAEALALSPAFNYLAPGDLYLFAPETPQHKFNVIVDYENGVRASFNLCIFSPDVLPVRRAI